MQLHFQADDDIVNQIKQRTDISSAAELGRDAFSLLNWATAQVEAGRQIQAVHPNEEQIYVPVMDILNKPTRE